jgi:phosphoribosylaminoimidazole-succinocarboxamide synthase
VHGIQLLPGFAESQKLDEPLFTPSTKAEQGSHDENIHPDKGKLSANLGIVARSHTDSLAVKLIGQDLYDLVSSTAVKLYSQAAEYALAQGIILADTKFEFGLLPISPLRKSLESRLILIDEVLTPDSSRYWPVEGYVPGRSQPSFDKQYLRDWMVSKGFKKGRESGPPGAEGEGWSMPAEVVLGTEKRYLEVQTKLVLNNK